MNLLGPDIFCEIVIHVMPDGQAKIYMSKCEGTGAQMAQVVNGIIQAGIEFGRSHGVQIQFTAPAPGPKP